MSGKAAAFGGRMMNAVAEQILKQFADNFAVQVAALAAQRNAAAAPCFDCRERAATLPRTRVSPQTAGQLNRILASCRRAKELNGLALMWAVLKDWLRGLFGKEAA